MNIDGVQSGGGGGSNGGVGGGGGGGRTLLTVSSGRENHYSGWRLPCWRGDWNGSLASATYTQVLRLAVAAAEATGR